MHIKTTLESLQETCPDAVAQVEKNIRRGKSKSKNDPLDQFEWFYSYGIIVQSFSIHELLTGAQPKCICWQHRPCGLSITRGKNCCRQTI